MKTCAFALLFTLLQISGASGKNRECTFRVHAEGNAQDTSAFATRTQVAGKNAVIEKSATLSERDVIAFRPYRAADGTYGALFKLDEHGRIALDTLSIERRGTFVFVFVNGRAITAMQVDQRVSNGEIYLPAGLSAADIELMKKRWRLIEKAKR